MRAFMHVIFSITNGVQVLPKKLDEIVTINQLLQTDSNLSSMLYHTFEISQITHKMTYYSLICLAWMVRHYDPQFAWLGTVYIPVDF